MLSGLVFWKNNFLNALSFLTIIKTKPQGEFSGAVHSFATVGLFIGAGLAACAFTGAVAPFVMVVYLAVITRFLHLDGLSDTFDGLLSNRPKDEMLVIMKDSRVGAMGAAALVLCLMGKLYAFTLIDSLWPLILIPAGARFTMAVLVYFTPYARSQGLGKVFDNLSFKYGFWQVIPVIALSLIGMGTLKTALLICVFIAVYLAVRMWFMRTVGGVTGDMCGAMCEIAETSAFLAAGAFPVISSGGIFL